jgi:hypothetical protein
MHEFLLRGNHYCINSRLRTENYDVLNLSTDRDSSVGIVNRYGLDGPGIEYQWSDVFRPPTRRALEPIQPLIQRVPGLFWG